MKKIILCLIAVPLIGGMTACKEKPKSEDIIVAKYVPDAPKAPVKLPKDVRATNVEWMGNSFTVQLSREPADTTHLLQDETGQEYVDNLVTLNILRSDSSSFFKKVFTKETFAAHINADFCKNGIFENLVFHGIENQQLKFGAVISWPGNEDEFIPLDVMIDKNGGMVIMQGKLFDEIEDDDSVKD